MEKHTPGPLFGPFASRADAINGYPFGMGGLIVKRNHAYWLDLEPLLVTDAAPDLLAALEEWAEYAENRPGEFSFMERTRAAIAKAGGE